MVQYTAAGGWLHTPRWMASSCQHWTVIFVCQWWIQVLFFTSWRCLQLFVYCLVWWKHTRLSASFVHVHLTLIINLTCYCFHWHVRTLVACCELSVDGFTLSSLKQLFLNLELQSYWYYMSTFLNCRLTAEVYFINNIHVQQSVEVLKESIH